jgi:hypothetical protein
VLALDSLPIFGLGRGRDREGGYEDDEEDAFQSAGRFHPLRSVLTEIYLCHTCSCHERLRMETPGQVGRPPVGDERRGDGRRESTTAT